MEEICTIPEDENRQYCQITEQRVKEALQRNADKITPRWLINLQEIRDPRTNKLPFDNLDIINSIKYQKDITPGY